MAKVYSNGVTLPTGFKRQFPAPGFDDEIWEFVDDLETIPNQFVGMEVFVLEDQRKWTKKNIGWIPEQSIDTTLYRQKTEKAANLLQLEAESDTIIVDQKATFLFTNGGETSTIKYLRKIINSDLNYDGREYTFINKQSTPITFKDNDATVEPLALKFDFNGEDFVLQPNESFSVKWLNYLGKFVLLNSSEKKDFRNNFKINVSQTTNIVQIPFTEKVTITSLEAITNVDSFSDFVVWKGNTALTARTTIAAVNTDIAALTSSEVLAGYTVQFKLNLIAGQSNASAILKTVKI
ncbi:MAG: hypothetical protein EOP00_11105 [Pedobacter sp.]|nr:MAG: hypothetical protein EOP00_11105 [Pedobacter sp.]